MTTNSNNDLSNKDKEDMPPWMQTMAKYYCKEPYREYYYMYKKNPVLTTVQPSRQKAISDSKKDSQDEDEMRCSKGCDNILCGH